MRSLVAMSAMSDILDHASIDAAVDAVLTKWGRIDDRFNNTIYRSPAIIISFSSVTTEPLAAP